jgi:cytochrome c oxidase subunit 3
MNPAIDQRYRTGMWIFLASETLLFAGLFALYAAYRDQYPVEFEAAAAEDIGWMGLANTLVLLVSSFFVASAIQLARVGRMRGAAGSLVLVLLLGGVFLALKLGEWHVHLSEGFAPGAAYASAKLPGHGAALFFTLYYAMTGLHALHLIIGMIVIAWLVLAIGAGRISRRRHLPLELGGLYWHFVDVVWLFLWPLFYLVR